MLFHWYEEHQHAIARALEEFHNRPENIAEAIGIFERNVQCKECGVKALKIISWKDKKYQCANCRKLYDESSPL